MMRKVFGLLVLLLLLLPPVCSQLPSLRSPSYIHIWSKIYNWSREDARYFCKHNFTDLLTIRNAAENSWLYTFGGWMGLYRNGRNDTWKWTDGDEEATFFSWAHDQPVLGDNCAFKQLNSVEWFSGHCHMWTSFLCSEDRVVLVKEEKTWEEALAHCRALDALNYSRPAQDYQNHRYDLVSLLTLDDLAFAREKAAAATTDGVWTGLRFLSGRWFWVDGEAAQEGQLLPGEPTPGSLSSCGALGTNSGDSVQASDCALRKNFLCYKNFDDQVIKIKEGMMSISVSDTAPRDESLKATLA